MADKNPALHPNIISDKIQEWESILEPAEFFALINKNSLIDKKQPISAHQFQSWVEKATYSSFKPSEGMAEVSWLLPSHRSVINFSLSEEEPKVKVVISERKENTEPGTAPWVKITNEFVINSMSYESEKGEGDLVIHSPGKDISIYPNGNVYVSETSTNS